MMTHPIVFLDIDGVLVTLASWGTATRFDPAAVKNLNLLTDATEARIVISSSWRFIREINDLLRAAGVTGQIIGRTPRLDGCSRGAEITAWLRFFNVETAPYVILDDDGDMDDLMNHLLRTTFDLGLTAECADEAIRVIRRNQAEHGHASLS